MTQARIDRLYTSGDPDDADEAAALLARFMDSLVGKTPRSAPRQLKSQPPERRQQHRRESRSMRRRSPSPYNLIQENLTELSAEPEDMDRYHSGKRLRQPSPISDKAESRKRIDQKGQSSKSEAELVEALLLSGKGRMVLANGDVVENGRIIVLDDSKEMDKSLPHLSPVLLVYLQTFKAYIPLSVFDRTFLVEDGNAWQTRKAPSAAKIMEGGATVKVYGNEPPMEELTMQYEQWLDAMTLFIKYVRQEGWETQAERFEGHKVVVMELREKIGWMVALRYCVRVRQGLMRMTVDKKIYNITKIQSVILDEVKQTCENNNERAYRTNPYAPGGPKADYNPETGLPRTDRALKRGGTSYEKVTSSSYSRSSAYENAKKTKEGWLPDEEYREKKAAEQRNRSKRDYDRNDRRGRRSPDRSNDRRDDWKERRASPNRGHNRGYETKRNDYYGKRS